YNSLGSALYHSRRPREAGEAWEEGRRRFAALTAAFPGIADFQVGQGRVLGNQGWLALRQQDFDRARQLLQDAVALVKPALALNPPTPASHGALRSGYLHLAEVLQQLGEHAEAARVAAELPAVNPDRAQDYYLAARLLARCVKVVQQDNRLPEPERRAL